MTRAGFGKGRLAGFEERLRAAAQRARLAWSTAEAPSAALLMLTAVAVLLTWNIPTTDPGSLGGDRDFWYLIGLAADRGMDFGNSLATSYGPLYFLTAPSITHPGEVLLAYITWSIFAVASISALAQSRKSAFAILFVAVIGISTAATPASLVITSMPVLLFLLSLAESLGALPRWMHYAFPMFGATFIAILALNKFSTAGITAAAVVAAILIRPGRERWTAIIQFVATGGVVAIGLWLISGQRILSLASYIYRGLTVGTGYNGALGMELAGNLWEYIFVLAGLAFLVVVLLKARPRGNWILATAWMALMIAPVWLMFKQGFVRHDSHSAQFFSLVASVAALAAYHWHHRLIASLVALFLVVQVAAFGQNLTSVDPAQHVATFGQGLTSSFVPTARKQRLQTAASTIKAEAKLAPALIQRVGDKTVYIEPFNHSITYAYGMNAAIIPTILEYGAYNHDLDRLNSDWFTNEATAPSFILRRISTLTVDSRNPLWDSPSAKIQETCLYRIAQTDGDWILLERRQTSVCGSESTDSTTFLPAGTSLTVPATSGSLTVLRVLPKTSAAEQIRSLLLKPSELKVTHNGTSYRLPWGDTDSPLIVTGYDYNHGRTDDSAAVISVNEDSTVTVGHIPIASVIGS